MTVFTTNGLAFVRLRQRRVQEALDPCTSGVARLDEHLDPERHRLHRSVLLFNIAQGPRADRSLRGRDRVLHAVDGDDPNYSEYYNDRGTVHFKMGHLQDAERDYLRAIELSPPDAEVWTNLGQCDRAMERMDDAIAAYSRALDRDPARSLALLAGAR